MEAQEPSEGSELLGGVPGDVPWDALKDVPWTLARGPPADVPLGDALEGLPGALLRGVAPADVPPEGASLENA